jgi:methylmalonyl-CoA mutase N-terminal domain/subunit
VTVGVNGYTDDDEQEIPTLHIDQSVEADQLARLAAFKAARDQEALRASLEQLRAACVAGENVMPVLVDAVERGVTLGEACDIYREVFGVYRDPGLI